MPVSLHLRLRIFVCDVSTVSFDHLKVDQEKNYKILTGKFLSPFESFLPGVMPVESRKVK